jgi:hypothetical protein
LGRSRTRCGGNWHAFCKNPTPRTSLLLALLALNALFLPSSGWHHDAILYGMQVTLNPQDLAIWIVYVEGFTEDEIANKVKPCLSQPPEGPNLPRVNPRENSS